MAKIDVTLPDDLKEMLEELAEDTGQSLSSVAADCIKLGILDFVEARNKMEVYRKLRQQRLDKEKLNPELQKKALKVQRRRPSKLKDEPPDSQIQT